MNTTVSLVLGLLATAQAIYIAVRTTKASTKANDASDLTQRNANLMDDYGAALDRRDRELATMTADREYWRNRALACERGTPPTAAL